jgi:hypothetical protein
VGTLLEEGSLLVAHDYEDAFAVNRDTGEKLDLGSHYGDPEGAVLVGQVPFLVVWGEGLTARRFDGPLVEVFREGCEPAANRLALASPPDPDWPGNPWPERLYPVEIESVEAAAEGIRCVVRPAHRLPSRWAVRLTEQDRVLVEPVGPAA